MRFLRHWLQRIMDSIVGSVEVRVRIREVLDDTGWESGPPEDLDRTQAILACQDGLDVVRYEDDAARRLNVLSLAAYLGVIVPLGFIGIGILLLGGHSIPLGVASIGWGGLLLVWWVWALRLERARARAEAILSDRLKALLARPPQRIDSDGEAIYDLPASSRGQWKREEHGECPARE